MISKEKMLVMLELQNKMNTIVNPDWMNAGYNWTRAILVESVEAMDHHGWKWWKKQEIDMPQLKMEMVDIWHFALSHFMVSDEFLKDIAYDISSNVVDHPVDIEFNSCTYLWNRRNLLEDLELMASMAGLGEFSVPLFNNIMLKMGFTWDELYETYIAKNVLNQFRQKNGYKAGTYVKDWSSVKLVSIVVEGRALEDNDHLHDIMVSVPFNTDSYVEVLMVELQQRYDVVLIGEN